ncbi:hypothetical protein ACFE04_018640 [Oxalis oulophora]
MSKKIEIDTDQEWLLNCLTATLDPSHDLRSFAETSLLQASLQPAAVLLKQFIKKHWDEGDDYFQHPPVTAAEKVIIRSLLLTSLDDSHRKICTAISMAVASIASYDWPDDWPDLLPFLLNLINNQNNLNGVHGALRCLALLCTDLDDTTVPKLIPVLFPCMHTIVSSPQTYDKYLRTKAISIVYSCTSMLGDMSMVYKTETTDLMRPMLKAWMDQFHIILEQPVQSEDPADWSVRTEVLKCLNQFVLNFHSLAENEFASIVGPLWQTFVSTLRVYVRSSVEGVEDPHDGSYDSDGSEKSLDSFVIQLFEFLLTIIGSARLGKVVANNVKELVYHTIAFLQITDKQVHIWSTDGNQFMADEDDATYSCRTSGLLLLEEIVNSFGEEGNEAIVDAAKIRYSESQQEKAAGSAVWWRLKEATLYALASLSEQLPELEEEASEVSIANFLEQMVAEDIGTDVNQYPFLCARIFISAAKFSSMIKNETLEHVVSAAIQTVSMNSPPAVKVGACRALSEILPETKKEIMQSQMMGLFSSLTDLLYQASDESLHLVLETLEAAAKACQDDLASIEPIISPIILNVWASHVSDPFISTEAVEVLETIKNAPGCIFPLASRILPQIGPILNKPQQSDGFVAESLDLITMLLKNAPIDVIKAVYDVCFDAVIRIILQSDDHSEMQNATECLAAFISQGKQELLSWGGDSGFTMRSLLDAASRLLDPSLDSSGSLFVGSYILQLILHLPSQMQQHIRDLVAALVKRMQSAQIESLRSSLILIFARMVHMSAPNVENFINLLVSIPAEGHGNSFVYVMSEWMKLQGEIQGAYQIKVTTSALVLLLSTKHAELGNINVQGRPIESRSGISTRSRTKSTPQQWTVVPLPEKMMGLLADAVIEILEQVSYGQDEDSDWEEVHNGDMDSDKDLVRSTHVKSSGKPTYENLEAMAKLYENEDDNDDLVGVGDPLNEINLAKYLVDFFSKLCHGEKQLFDNLSQNLTTDQQNAIRIILNRKF